MYQQDALPVPRIVKAKGAYLYLDNGQPVLDGISSWWVNLHGHSHPSINAAIRDQLEQFEHVILAGFSHEPITQLATRLVELTPPALTRCFFADSGSAAVEIALKMSLQYWSQKAGHQSGQPGSGLGLAIVKEIVALHAGSLTLGPSGFASGLKITVELPQ